jgi:hypothetical protein
MLHGNTVITASITMQEEEEQHSVNKESHEESLL